MSTAMPSACQAGQARRGQVWQPFSLARLSVTVLNTKLRPEMSSCHFSLLCVAFLINIINVCARPSSLCCVPVNVCVCVCVCQGHPVAGSTGHIRRRVCPTTDPTNFMPICSVLQDSLYIFGTRANV